MKQVSTVLYFCEYFDFQPMMMSDFSIFCITQGVSVEIVSQCDCTIKFKRKNRFKLSASRRDCCSYFKRIKYSEIERNDVAYKNNPALGVRHISYRRLYRKVTVEKKSLDKLYQ